MRTSAVKLLVTLALVTGAFTLAGDAIAASRVDDSTSSASYATSPPVVNGDPDQPNPHLPLPSAPVRRSSNPVREIGDWVRMWWATWFAIAR
jgi:hypothetical protein